MICFLLFEQFFEYVCVGLYCHNKRDGGGGEEGNAAFVAASWKGKDWLILPHLSVCAFTFRYFASSMSFWWLLHATEGIQENKFKERQEIILYS